MHRLARGAAFVVATLGLLHASTAFGQSTTPTSVGASGASAAVTPEARDAEARALFDQGVAALADERYSDAHQAFARSYEIRRVASVALNLGIALRALGRVTEARQRFSEFVEMASPAQHERHDREVAGYIQDVSRRIARIHIAAVVPESARILVDGRRVTRDENDEVAVDPGEHRVEAQLQGFTGEAQRVTLEPGARLDVRLTLVAERPDPRVTLNTNNSNARANNGNSTRPAAAPPPPVTSSPWFWVAIGGAVVATAAVTTAIVLSTREQTLPGLFCFRTDGSRCATGAQ